MTTPRFYIFAVHIQNKRDYYMYRVRSGKGTDFIMFGPDARYAEAFTMEDAQRLSKVANHLNPDFTFTIMECSTEKLIPLNMRKIINA